MLLKILSRSAEKENRGVMCDGTKQTLGAVSQTVRFIEQLRQGFERLAEIRGYTDDQFRKLEDALYQLEPVPEELDDLLVNYRPPPFLLAWASDFWPFR